MQWIESMGKCIVILHCLGSMCDRSQLVRSPILILCVCLVVGRQSSAGEGKRVVSPQLWNWSPGRYLLGGCEWLSVPGWAQGDLSVGVSPGNSSQPWVMEHQPERQRQAVGDPSTLSRWRDVFFTFPAFLRPPSWLRGKESACQCRGRRFNPWIRKSPGEGDGNPRLHSFLEKPHGQRSLEAMVHGVTKDSDTILWLNICIPLAGPHAGK